MRGGSGLRELLTKKPRQAEQEAAAEGVWLWMIRWTMMRLQEGNLMSL